MFGAELGHVFLTRNLASLFIALYGSLGLTSKPKQQNNFTNMHKLKLHNTLKKRFQYPLHLFIQLLLV